MITEMNPEQNNYNLTPEDVKAFVSFNIGHTNNFCEYINGVSYWQKEPFTPEKLNQHLVGTKVFGFSPFSDNENVMFGAIDFDAHRDKSDTDEEYQIKVTKAQEDAVKIYQYMKSFKLPVILNSSGSAGRHVRWFCGGAPAKNVRMYLKYVQYKLFGDPNANEVFPKQDCLVELHPFGNQIKGMLCVHPKHKKRANIIAGDTILDISDSIKVMKMALENAGNVPPFSQSDYDMVDSLDKSHIYLEKYNTPEHLELTQDIPEYCAFFEEVAVKYPLPSKDKYSRHFCLDSNMAGYGITHPDTRIVYANMQSRTSHTAFDNWRKYWVDGKPEFRCAQIISYLRNWTKYGNKEAKIGLTKCLNCPKFKEFMDKKFAERLGEPKGWANSLSILELAKEYDYENCQICNTPFKFTDSHGMYYCKTCHYGGGLKKFARLIIKKRKASYLSGGIKTRQLNKMEKTKMDKEQAIEEAKKLAKEDYDNLMIKHGCHDPSYVRSWRKQATDEGEAYALEGTPDKAYVFVYPKYKKVLAVRVDGSIIKSFKFE